MRPEEIRSANIEQPRRVRPLSRDERDQREENRERFARDLASLEDDDGLGRRKPRPGARPRAAEPEPQDEPDPTDTPEDAAVRPPLGRNLDITT